MSVSRPWPGAMPSSRRRRRFHLASECTTTARCSSRALMGKPTGRSTPFKSSLMPVPSSTTMGADTFTRCSPRASSRAKVSFTNVMAASVSSRPAATGQAKGVGAVSIGLGLGVGLEKGVVEMRNSKVWAIDGHLPRGEFFLKSEWGPERREGKKKAFRLRKAFQIEIMVVISFF